LIDAPSRVRSRTREATLTRRAHWRAGRAHALCRAASALVLVLLGVLAGRPAPAAPFTDTIAQRVLACTGCHGREGRAAADGYYPRIAGKPAGYLFNQLRNFRDERRHYELMSGLLEFLDDAYLREIADYFAALDLPYPAPPAPAETVVIRSAGETLVRHGDPARGLPACNDCHGVAMTGRAPFIPGLLGLPRDYLNAQLGAWKSGLRKAAPPDCMAQVAARLTPTDIGAVSAWLAAQAVPVHAVTAAQPLATLPLACSDIDDERRPAGAAREPIR
jgi:cytochrome c553